MAKIIHRPSHRPVAVYLITLQTCKDAGSPAQRQCPRGPCGSANPPVLRRGQCRGGGQGARRNNFGIKASCIANVRSGARVGGPPCSRPRRHCLAQEMNKWRIITYLAIPVCAGTTRLMSCGAVWVGGRSLAHGLVTPWPLLAGVFIGWLPSHHHALSLLPP